MDFDKLKRLLLSLLFTLVCGVSGGNLSAQEPVSNIDVQQRFNLAKTLLASYKNDSARLVLNELYRELDKTDSLNTSFGLRVQFRRAESLEKDQQDDLALAELLWVKERSQEYEVWDVYTNCCLIMANLYEKIGRGADCRKSLELAGEAIDAYAQDSLYPSYAIRTSSYNRFFGDHHTALFYAQEVLRTAPLYGQEIEEANGHLLMGILLRAAQPRVGIDHFMAASLVFERTGDYTGHSFMQHNLARIYLRLGELDRALAHSDTSLAVATLAIVNGADEDSALPYGYSIRSEIYGKMGMLDSALHYEKLSHQLEVENLTRKNNQEVVEIDARYKDEKKALLIAEQERRLQFDATKRDMLWGIITLSLLFAGVLTYSYLKLRRANLKTEEQSVELAAALNRQLDLQAELNHRVKNNLQIIINLLDLQKEKTKDAETREDLDAMANRIYSMSAIHETLLQQDGSQGIDFASYTRNLCTHFSNLLPLVKRPRFILDVEQCYFNLATLMPLGIILNELLTNSIKHAYSPNKPLIISLKIKSVPRVGYVLNYRDNGPGFPGDHLGERSGGMGNYLLRSMCRQLRGQLESRNSGGAEFDIRFQAKEAI